MRQRILWQWSKCSNTLIFQCLLNWIMNHHFVEYTKYFEYRGIGIRVTHGKVVTVKVIIRSALRSTPHQMISIVPVQLAEIGWTFMNINEQLLLQNKQNHTHTQKKWNKIVEFLNEMFDLTMLLAAKKPFYIKCVCFMCCVHEA